MRLERPGEIRSTKSLDQIEYIISPTGYIDLEKLTQIKPAI
ncbi:MAG: hypothetical protein PHF86_03320 [Candidatus Nanoarchaeia archaeon]|jgi:hypothetical protein|nr:hypothetical protein [Candidatus Nanoarchaeia archaeon]